MLNSTVVESLLAEAGRPARVAATRDLSGGCIHRVVEVTLDDGQRVVVKSNASDQLGSFREEWDSLEALAGTGTVLVPKPIAVGARDGGAYLIVSHLRRVAATSDAWTLLGEELAALHRAPEPGAHGFHGANHLGATLQPNDWCEDWVQFNRAHRIGFQLDLARQRGALDGATLRLGERLLARLGEFLPARPPRGLLHGDLWSGNAIPCGERVAIIDPACSYGDGWADIAMMQLFGGFPAATFDAYARAVGECPMRRERVAIYQLYHVLNHANMFGGGYGSQASTILRSLVG